MKNQPLLFAAYLAELPEWDKTSRLDTLFTGYLGANNTLFNKKAAELLGIATVARVECPGIPWNHMPILHGQENCGKSLFLKALFHGSAVIEISSAVTEISSVKYADKQLCELIDGFTCIELSCLPFFQKKTETLRNFISRNHDEYRKTYHQQADIRPRQCVFVATTSDSEQFLIDPTGNMRYWGINIKIKELDIDALLKERDQIWAEAKHLWQLAVVAAGDKCSIDLDAMAANLPKDRDSV